MAGQHKVSLEKTLQSALMHKAAGSRVAETIASIEAMVLTGIATTAVVDSQNKSDIGRCRAGLAHREYGKRMQDAWETLRQIIADESLTLTAGPVIVSGQHKAKLNKIVEVALASKRLGQQVSDMCDLQDKALDALLVAYPGGPVHTALLAIKNT